MQVYNLKYFMLGICFYYILNVVGNLRTCSALDNIVRGFLVSKNITCS